jgi:hypothetical protein
MTRLAWIAVVALSSGAVLAEQLKIAPEQRYLALMTVKTSTLQKELDQAAASGFEVVFANTMGVLMKRAAAGATAAEYHLTAVERIATLEKELNASAQKGFVVVPGTVTKAGDETMVLSRRTSGSSDRYSYRVLKSDDAVESNLRDMASKGFSPVGAFLQQSGFGAMMSSPTTGSLHIVLQGPAEGASVVPARRARVLSTTKTSTMERELNETAAKGFRVTGASLMKVMLEENEDPSAKLEYKLIAAVRYETLKNEIIAAGREGFRIVPRAIMHNQQENILIMERPAGSGKPNEYQLIETDLKTRDMLDRTILPLEDQGFSPVSLFLHHKYIVVMEKGPKQ